MLGGRGAGATVVVELVLGVLIGPQVLGLETSSSSSSSPSLGLGMLFFFAGYEIDLRRIAGAPLRLAALGWALSLALAYTVGGILAAAGVVLSLLYTGSALHDGDRHAHPDPVGHRRAADAVRHLPARRRARSASSARSCCSRCSSRRRAPLHKAIILIVFVALAVGVAVLAVRSSHHTLPLFERTLHKSSQLAVRWIVVLVFALALLAAELGLDLLLGGFAAGLITRQVLKEHEVPGFDAKLTAVAFGVFVPFFFVVSGMRLDVEALFSSAAAIAKLALFFVLFLVVRGVPALVLYGGVFDRRDRMALAFFQSTQLPLVLAITTLAREGGHMPPRPRRRSSGAAVLSTLFFPILGLRLRGDARGTRRRPPPSSRPPRRRADPPTAAPFIRTG